MKAKNVNVIDEYLLIHLSNFLEGRQNDHFHPRFGTKFGGGGSIIVIFYTEIDRCINKICWL